MSTDSSFERAKECFVLGNAAFESGQLIEAERQFLESLRWLPGRPSTLSNLGATRIALGRHQEALEPLAQALEGAPTDAQVWSKQGFALSCLGRLEEAQASHARALEIDAGRVGDWVQRALSLMGLKRHAEALACLDQALKLRPDDAQLHYRKGQALILLQRPPQALAALQRAVQLDATLHQAWGDLGSLLSESGRHHEALDAWQQALQHGGDQELLRYQMAGEQARLAAGLSASETPAHPPRAYVEQLFDDYAEGFDEHLTRLGYQAPKVLASGLGRLLSARPGELATAGRGVFRHALDLGCGTGLCAAPLGPWTLRLTGIDVSAQMLEKAQALQRYDRLLQADLIEHLNTTPDRHDLVVAADVFVYVGALEAVFAGVRRVIEPGGVFCFSVESIGDDRDYALLSSLRYGHSSRYLHHLAPMHGFELAQLRPGPLRHDEQHAVSGLYAWCVATQETVSPRTE
ncbi:MAG: tetratricopeptide repeat protein [Rubrivivax sp.]